MSLLMSLIEVESERRSHTKIDPIRLASQITSQVPAKMSGVTFFRLRLFSCLWLNNSCPNPKKFETLVTPTGNSCQHFENFQITHIKSIVSIYARAILPFIEHNWLKWLRIKYKYTERHMLRFEVMA